MKKTLLFTACLLTIFISIVDARQGRHREGAWPEQDWAVDHMMISNLDLTKDQTEKIQALTEAFHKDLAPLRYKKFQLQTELRLLWMQEKLDRKKIQAKQNELHDLKGQIMEKVTAYRFSFREVLTSEQLSKFLERRCDRPFPSHGGRGYHGFRAGERGKDAPPSPDESLY